MKRYFLVLTGLLVTSSVAMAAWSQDGPPGRRGGGAGHRRGMPGIGMLKKELGLTDAQTSQIEKLKSDQRKAAIRRGADLRIARIELRDMLQAETVDEKAVSAKLNELTTLQAAAAKARVDGVLAFRKVLTPEQVQKMRELKDRPRQMRQRRQGPGRGPRSGDLDGADEDETGDDVPSADEE